MNIRLVSKILSVVITFPLFYGCATLGSSAEMRDQDAFHRIHKVYLPAFQVSWGLNVFKSNDTTIVAPRVYALLHAKVDSIFTTLQPDSLEIPDVAHNFDEAVQLGKKHNCDGVLFVEMRYYQPLLDAPATECSFTLLECSTGHVIAVSSHNTHWGNSYLMVPSPDRTTYDAIIGCVEAFKKSINQNNQSSSAR